MSRTDDRTWMLFLLISLSAGCNSERQQAPAPAFEMAPVELVESSSGSDRNDSAIDYEAAANALQDGDMQSIPRPVGAEAVESFQLPDQIELPPRAVLNAARLNLIETNAARIVTDLSKEEIEGLAFEAGQVWSGLEKAFGPIRDDVPVDTVPLTAFVVFDVDSFAQAGLFQKLPTTIHGRHNGWQFWIRWPSASYYQTHLFAHEAAHCYSLITQPDVPAGWKESIAEWFATYRKVDGQLQFGTIPLSPDEVPGWGRIELLQQDLASGRRYSARDVAAMEGARFQGVPTAYAWAWALSALMNAVEPEVFQALIRQTTSGVCSSDDVLTAATRLDRSGLWSWWIASLTYGIDPALAAPQVLGKSDQRDGATDIEARGGWQGAGEVLAPGEQIVVRASGRVVLNSEGRPWESTPKGIRVDYAGGIPVGSLLACTLREGQWSPVYPVGAEGTVASSVGGELFFRVNDHWNDLSNNTGSYQVEFSRQPTGRDE